MALDTSVEVERKYDVDDAATVPDLSTVNGVASVAAPVEHVLVATYFDTRDLRLGRSRTTLRRRTGGGDEGWHLKLPLEGGDRLEVHRPLGRSLTRVPTALESLVRVHVRTEALVPVASLTTHRTVRHVLDGAGGVLAEIADDRVTGKRLGDGGQVGDVSVWRELEIELVTGDRALLAALDEAVRGAGATPAASASKVARVLGAAANTSPAESQPARGPVSKESTAGEVLQAHLGAQHRELLSCDPRVRADVPDAVHKMRVATRRLRSALATYRPLVDRTVTDPVRAELRWLGTVLGAPRDAEVMHDRLRSALADEPRPLVVGPVARRVDRELARRLREGRRLALAELDGERYLALLDALDALATDPPLTRRAADRATDRLLPLVARTLRTLRRRVADVEGATTDEERAHLLHEARKAAKRARYAGESVSAVFGAKAARFAERMEHVQDVLGEHQDTVVTREQLVRLAAAARAAGEDAFTYGRLHALQQARADELESEFAVIWKALSGRSSGQSSSGGGFGWSRLTR